MLYSEVVRVTNLAKARVFMSGRSQHVTIPMDFRFRSKEVSIRRDQATGDVILSEIPSMDEIFAELDAEPFPEGFLDPTKRKQQKPQKRLAMDALFKTPKKRPAKR